MGNGDGTFRTIVIDYLYGAKEPPRPEIPSGTPKNAIIPYYTYDYGFPDKFYNLFRETNESFCNVCAYQPWCGRCPIIIDSECGSQNATSEKSTYCKMIRASFDTVFDLITYDRESMENYFRLSIIHKLINSY